MDKEKEEFLVSLNHLNETKEKEKALEKRLEELRQAHYEFEQIDRELISVASKLKRLHRYLEICRNLYGDDMKKIVKRLIRAKETGYQLFSKKDNSQDHLLFDEIREHFVTYNSKTLEYHISLFYNHFRHYDLNYIMKRVEEITRMKISGYYFMTKDGMYELYLVLVEKEKIKVKK